MNVTNVTTGAGKPRLRWIDLGQNRLVQARTGRPRPWIGVQVYRCTSMKIIK